MKSGYHQQMVGESSIEVRSTEANAYYTGRLTDKKQAGGTEKICKQFARGLLRLKLANTNRNHLVCQSHPWIFPDPYPKTQIFVYHHEPSLTAFPAPPWLTKTHIDASRDNKKGCIPRCTAKLDHAMRVSPPPCLKCTDIKPIPLALAARCKRQDHLVDPVRQAARD